ncbi:serine carboxypeptidase [Hygrophoropsis aurantiaca]|uniref:Serine carboxypeptidase n=1 Tax=Hygrophoropsis aurantiaca TaxID=72124 RepID=A0ACB8A9F0_9AGAM|nr:serine carboxypeptidase [Hygrophoropsis aurantiaca]
MFPISFLLGALSLFHIGFASRPPQSQSPWKVTQPNVQVHTEQGWTLSALPGSHFTTLAHPSFPAYSVRVKKSQFCDQTVNAYTGYIDIEARHLFFYFFESRNDPASDDVIFWTNGGPGASSSIGLFMELGPCGTLAGNGTTYNPYSWNTNANIFFVDQPVGVGFSYAEFGETVSTTEEAAKDIAAFVAIFFEHFTAFRGRAFHMAGESYGGRYIPIFAAEVYDQNAKLVEAGLTPINLQSVMIGNGFTDWATTWDSYIEMVCSPVSIFPIQSIAACVRMKDALPRCQKWAKKACFDVFDSIGCKMAMDFCSKELEDTFDATGKNPYDISKDCEGDIADTLCYPETKTIAHYLNRPDIRAILGTDPSVPPNISVASATVGAAFDEAQDGARVTVEYVAALLERGIRTLIYAGEYDWICNWVGNEAWTRNMKWSGQKGYVAQPLRTWSVDGHEVGKTRSANGLTFATIQGAGHMAPYDKPKESLELVRRWLAKQEL